MSDSTIYISSVSHSGQHRGVCTLLTEGASRLELRETIERLNTTHTMQVFNGVDDRHLYIDSFGRFSSGFVGLEEVCAAAACMHHRTGLNDEQQWDFMIDNTKRLEVTTQFVSGSRFVSRVYFASQSGVSPYLEPVRDFKIQSSENCLLSPISIGGYDVKLVQGLVSSNICIPINEGFIESNINNFNLADERYGLVTYLDRILLFCPKTLHARILNDFGYPEKFDLEGMVALHKYLGSHDHALFEADSITYTNSFDEISRPTLFIDSVLDDKSQISVEIDVLLHGRR